MERVFRERRIWKAPDQHTFVSEASVYWDVSTGVVVLDTCVLRKNGGMTPAHARMFFTSHISAEMTRKSIEMIDDWTHKKLPEGSTFSEFEKP